MTPFSRYILRVDSVMETSGENVTDLLIQWNAGDESALERLLPYLLPELRQLAACYMRGERAGHTLQTTALVNEAWLKLAQRQTWQNRSHFFAAAARIMRNILVDYARSRTSAKYGGVSPRLDLERILATSVSNERIEEWLLVNQALDKLSRCDVRKSRIIELRYFLGMTVEETAEVIGASPNTVIREWRLARAWLGREIALGSQLTSDI